MVAALRWRAFARGLRSVLCPHAQRTLQWPDLRRGPMTERPWLLRRAAEEWPANAGVPARGTDPDQLDTAAQPAGGTASAGASGRCGAAARTGAVGAACDAAGPARNAERTEGTLLSAAIPHQLRAQDVLLWERELSPPCGSGWHGAPLFGPCAVQLATIPTGRPALFVPRM